MHATVCDYIAEVVHNAIEANATHVALTVTTKPGELGIVVRDNGKGMTAAQLERAKSPFYTEPGKHDKRKVGLGLSFLLQATQAADGYTDVRSEPGKGTEVRFGFDPAHLDTPPMGDFPRTMTALMSFPGDHDLALHRAAEHGAYDVSRSELLDALGNLDEAGNLGLATQFFQSQEEQLDNPEPEGIQP